MIQFNQIIFVKIILEYKWFFLNNELIQSADEINSWRNVLAIGKQKMWHKWKKKNKMVDSGIHQI